MNWTVSEKLTREATVCVRAANDGLESAKVLLVVKIHEAYLNAMDLEGHFQLFLNDFAETIAKAADEG